MLLTLTTGRALGFGISGEWVLICSIDYGINMQYRYALQHVFLQEMVYVSFIVPLQGHTK